MIEVKPAIDVEDRCLSCGAYAFLKIRSATYPQFVTVTNYCSVCADELMLQLSQNLGHGVLDPDADDPFKYNEE